MALAADRILKVQYPDPPKRHMKVAASVNVFQYALVAMAATGAATPAPAAQNLPFMGISILPYDNSSGVETTDEVLEIDSGATYQLTIATVAITDRGKPVYYVDDETVTLTAPANKQTRVGTITNVITTGASGLVAVDIDKAWPGAEF